MKFKAEQFFKDIGLDLTVEILNDGSMVEQGEITNVIYMSSHITTNNEVAVMRAIDNLNATYGKDKVTEILKKLVNE